MKTLAIVDVSGLIVNRVVVDDASGWEPPAGCISVPEDFPMEIGATYSKGIYTPLPKPSVPPPNYSAQAMLALTQSDTTLLRCLENAVVVPKEWQEYRTSLRAVLKSGQGPLPTRPAYPAGT